MSILSDIPAAVESGMNIADRQKAKIKITYRRATPGKRAAFVFSNDGGHDATDLMVTADLPVNFHPCDGRTQYRLPVLYAGESDHAVQFLPGFGHEVDTVTLTVCYTDGTGSHHKQRTLHLR